MDRKLLAYWIATALLVPVFGGGGVADLMRPENVTEVFERLGYPDYMLTIIGVAKLIDT